MSGTGTGAGLHAIETASRDEIEALQLERLKATLAHAHANVAPFRAKCEARGVHPDDLVTHADLATFPFTLKSDLRDNYPFGLTAVPMEDVVRIHASSGTTGKPTVVTYTQADIDHWADLVARSIHASGGRRRTSCTSPTATGCSPAGSVRTTGPSGSAAR